VGITGLLTNLPGNEIQPASQPAIRSNHWQRQRHTPRPCGKKAGYAEGSPVLTSCCHLLHVASAGGAVVVALAGGDVALAGADPCTIDRSREEEVGVGAH